MGFPIICQNPLHSCHAGLPRQVTVDVRPTLVVDHQSLIGDGHVAEDGLQGQQVPQMQMTRVGPGSHVCWVIPPKASVRI